MVVRYVLNVMYLCWLLKALLVWVASCQRSLEIELSGILILCTSWMNPYNCILVKNLIVVSVTVVLGIVW